MGFQWADTDATVLFNLNKRGALYFRGLDPQGLVKRLLTPLQRIQMHPLTLATVRLHLVEGL